MPKKDICPCGKDKWNTSEVCLTCSRLKRQVSHLTHRQCKLCHEIKESSSMKKNSNGSPSNVCYKCGNLNRFTKNPEYRARNTLNEIKRRLKAYGVDVENFMPFYESQLTCELCLEPFTNKNYKCIDHCHTDKLYRGLICNDCNLGLGRFKDDPEKLKLAIIYLEKFQEKRTPL